MATTGDIAREFFASNPQDRAHVLKAYHAYHVQHFKDDTMAHNFTNGSRDAACVWCGRTRELVRWDDQPPECQCRPDMPDVADVIHGEEQRAFTVLDRAAKDVPTIVAKHGMSGETLAMLHHTHGYDPETVDGVVTVPTDVMADYHTAMERERERSRCAQVKEVVSCVLPIKESF